MNDQPRGSNIPVKVHRVATVDEVLRLETVGVDYIGFHVDEDALWGIDPTPFWSDERYISLEQLAELLTAVTHARTFVECPPETLGDVTKVMAEFGTTLLQLNTFILPDVGWFESQKNIGLEIIYGNQYVVPGDDSRFLGLRNRDWPLLFGFDIQVFPSEKDAWELLSAPSPEVRRDIMLKEHIEKLAQDLPLFLSLNFNRENCTAIRTQFSTLPLKGFSFTLSPTKVGSFHTCEFDELAGILKQLQSQ